MKTVPAKIWEPGLSLEQEKDVGYWERNMLALMIADGWYNDDVLPGQPRFACWRRVLTAYEGRMTFHVPDDFEVGNLPEVKRNWDGHTTLGKWRTVAISRGFQLEGPS